MRKFIWDILLLHNFTKINRQGVIVYLCVSMDLAWFIFFNLFLVSSYAKLFFSHHFFGVENVDLYYILERI